MKAIHWIIAAAALAYVHPTQAATTDPEVIIYRFPGVRDDGGTDDVGVATVFHCTNFSGATETIRLVTRNFDATFRGNNARTINHLETFSTGTHFVAAYNSATLMTGPINQGTTAIAATSTNLICTAMTIDAANLKPDGVALHGIRFNPVPGSQE